LDIGNRNTKSIREIGIIEILRRNLLSLAGFSFVCFIYVGNVICSYHGIYRSSQVQSSQEVRSNPQSPLYMFGKFWCNERI